MLIISQDCVKVLGQGLFHKISQGGGLKCAAVCDLGESRFEISRGRGAKNSYMNIVITPS